ncbi:MAG: hypothetical protein H6831_16830 [Planctomycetes bacterium]|nr:hypothetical protein [Planctomycetota bacterium]MCB9906068.1 hypothetical protein [Planctomycetota bacterium]
MRPLTIASAAPLLALCAACTASGIHRPHDVRLHGGLHVPTDDVVGGMTTGDGNDKTWGIEYIHSKARGELGFEVAAFQSISDGSGTNTLPGLGLGPANVDKRMSDLRAGLNYPLERIWNFETDLGLGLAYVDTAITSNIDGGPDLHFEDQGPAAYAKIATMAPITDSIAVGVDLRYLAPFQNFEDTQQGVSFDANLSEWQATLFLALTW